MDVSLLTNTPYSAPRSLDNTDSFPGKRVAENQSEMPKENSEAAKVREEVIMNLQEVQNFLYMLIGSRLRIDTGEHKAGSAVNTCA